MAGAGPSDVHGHHVAAGLRVWLRDRTAVVLEARIELTRVERVAIALRPSLLFSGNAELRSSATLDYSFADWIRVYAGGGFSWNESGSGALETLASAGIDMLVGDRIVVNCHLNSLFQQDDIDTELFALVGVRRR